MSASLKFYYRSSVRKCSLRMKKNYEQLESSYSIIDVQGIIGPFSL